MSARPSRLMSPTATGDDFRQAHRCDHSRDRSLNARGQVDEPLPGGAVVHAHVRAAAGCRRRDDVGDGVAVDIAHRDPDPALETGVERQDAELLQTRLRINDPDPGF